MPRRRRGARAVAVEADAERGLAMRILLHSPKDLVAGVLAFAAASAIIANALFLQAGHHPSPMFGSVVVIPATGSSTALPRPRPVELATKSADTSPPESRSPESRSLESRSVETKPAELKPVETKAAAEPKAAEPKASDPLANLVKATAAMPVMANVPRPPAPIPVAASASHRVAAVQRALTEYGYGQLKPTGTVGSDTQAAIQKFEREHKLPVTGQLSDRLVRDLVAMTGHPID
jgi:Putative peptidoglycan binding domain